MWSTPSLPLHSDPLRAGVDVPVRDLSIDQIELFNHLTVCKQMSSGLFKMFQLLAHISKKRKKRIWFETKYKNRHDIKYYKTKQIYIYIYIYIYIRTHKQVSRTKLRATQRLPFQLILDRCVGGTTTPFSRQPHLIRTL